ncbi:MAG: AMP-binding protein [Alcanivorax sp.]|nr:AMP-binding protein [Alcanivorax sp.]
MMTTTNNAPTLLHGCDTVVKLWRQQCLERGARIAHREKDLGIWQSYSWQDYYEKARAIGVALLSLGLERGQPVSILSEDNKEWLYCDLGIAGAGGVSNGVYTTDSAEQLAYLVNDSGSAFLFVENDEQLDKYLTVRDQVPTLKKVIVFDRKGLRDFDDPMVMFLDELYALSEQIPDAEAQFSASIAQSQPDDIRMLIYTSGTTGAPKGAMISHRNVLFQLAAGEQVLEAHEDDDQLCFLPLCHILERLVSVEVPIFKGCTVNFAESPETVFDNMREVSPSTFFAVPRVWEKIYSRVLVMAQEATPVGRWAFQCAINAGAARAEYLMQNRPVPGLVAARYAVWDFAVLRNLRRMLGVDRLRRGGTGAAPISPELLKWYWSIGVRLLEGYGMTENAGLSAANTVENNRVSSVGLPVPGVSVRIADDGEIQTFGLNNFQGYWRNTEKTAETFTSDGWLRTGDVGALDADGYLTITGRIKDIIITAGQNRLSPGVPVNIDNTVNPIPAGQPADKQ